ncbi:MAG: hypothetical protein L3J12_04785, partial [Spirochaetales bacterium]|nr:hypothetical protein [Spirochaetales bacterium]
MLLGRYEEAEANCRVAEVLFPESPTFPMLLMLSASATGDSDQKSKLLEHPALGPLESSNLEEFVAALSAFHIL